MNEDGLLTRTVLLWREVSLKDVDLVLLIVLDIPINVKVALALASKRLKVKVLLGARESLELLVV